ncbi:MAG: hypothetical protein ACI828_000256 [Flavobacteriales bacterium]|jgi:hypothetical protein
MFTKIHFFFGLFMLAQISSAQTVLRYNLAEGDEFTIAQSAQQTITQEIPGRTQIIINDLKGVMNFKVTAVSEALITMEMHFKRFALKMSSPQLGVMMDIDTDKKDNPESTESLIFKGILNKSVYILMKPTGEITEVQQAEAIVNGMIESLGLEDAHAIEQMKQELEKEWSADGLAKSFEQMTFNYPNTVIQKEGTWTNKFIGKGKIHAQNTWTLEEPSTDGNSIKGNAMITMDLSNPQIEMLLEGSQQTTLKALANGFPKTMEVKTFASGDATIPGLPVQTIPTQLESTTTYTLL